jgi:hypothetical protein
MVRILAHPTYVGIDPGVNGGIAILSPIHGLKWRCMPATEYEIRLSFQEIKDTYPELAVAVEWIHPAIQGIGKSAMSKLYGSYIALRMCLSCLSIPYEIVKPMEWQRGLKIPGRNGRPSNQWKAELRAAAQRLFPEAILWSQTKKEQLQVCDAILIAAYLSRRPACA